MMEESEARAIELCRRNQDVAWPVEAIDAIAERHVDCQAFTKTGAFCRCCDRHLREFPGMKLLAILLNAVLMLAWLRAECRVQFYRAYFRQKQINRGEDPDQRIREIFPWAWWIYR